VVEPEYSRSQAPVELRKLRVEANVTNHWAGIRYFLIKFIPGYTKEVVMECEVVTEFNLARYQNGLNEI
jgi:hypothetical protein